MLLDIILGTALVLSIAALMLLVSARRRLETEQAFLIFMLIETTFGFAVGIFVEGWTRWLGFAVGVVSVIECTHCFSKTFAARQTTINRQD